MLADDAPSCVYADLAEAFHVAGIRFSERRNGRRRRGAARRQASSKYTREGRTILRDGQPIVSLQRVDLGDQRFAISPHETDVLTQRLVDLLNGKRRRQAASTTKHRIFVCRTQPKNGQVRTHWFEADPPTTFDDAKRRLVAAGLLDERILLPTEWKLVVDPPAPFRVPLGRLRPLP